MTQKKTILLAVALAALLYLEAYSFFYSSRLPSETGPTVEQLFANASFYEGKHVTLLYVLVKRHEISHLVVSEPGGKEQLVVNLPIEEAQRVKQGDLIAAPGISRVESKGAFEAETIHVYENWWWRPLVSFAGLAFAAFLLAKEKPWATKQNKNSGKKN